MRTPLNRHQKKGKLLKPPLSELSMQHSSWVDERLPEMLWALLLQNSFERKHYISFFKKILNHILNHNCRTSLYDVTLTGLSLVKDQSAVELVKYICYSKEVRRALSPMMLFPDLPGRNIWADALSEWADPKAANIESTCWSEILKSVGFSLDQASPNATDARWLRLMGEVVGGRVNGIGDLGPSLCDYPDVQDEELCRGVIRSIEVALSYPARPSDWSVSFWLQCWTTSPCIQMSQESSSQFDSCRTAALLQELQSMQIELETHWRRTLTSTSIDPKHDCVFGIASYGLRILKELVSSNTSLPILGRIALRTLLECHINLRHLVLTGDPELWKKWRELGVGQAKLLALKLAEGLGPPTYLDPSQPNLIASEDKWEELVDINLAGWSGLDLRRLSEMCDLKEKYDKHFIWTSGYVHANWHAIRDCCFSKCGNPLHRLHSTMQSVELSAPVQDSLEIMNCILGDVNQVYPPFSARLKTFTEPC